MHYDSGDLITYSNPAYDAEFGPGAISLGMVVREATNAEVSEVTALGSWGPFTSPAFWIYPINTNALPKTTAINAAGNGTNATLVEGSAIITVIKASGDNDAIAALLT